MSYISEIYDILKEYGLQKFFNLNEIRQWHKHQYDKIISETILKIEYKNSVNKLNNNKYGILARSIQSIVEHLVDDNILFDKTPVCEQDELIYHQKIYFSCLFYKLVGIDKNHSTRENHKFIMTMYLHSHPVYWYSLREVCRFCKLEWEDPLDHLVNKCCDYRITDIRDNLYNPNSKYYMELHNKHGKLYYYIYIKHFLKCLFSDYRQVINKRIS